MRETGNKGAVLITGAARRIGRQLALDLAVGGRPVAVHYNASQEDAEETAETIRSLGGEVALVTGDLADREGPDRIVSEASAAFGGIEVLINNASVFEPDEAGKLDRDTWDQHMAINLTAPVFLAQSFARQLADDANGNIVNIIDQRVLSLNPKFFSYTIAKSGLWIATRTLAQALSPRIRVNAIGPGPTLPSSRMDAADFAAQSRGTLLERATHPEEIARAVQFVLSAPAMTGQMIALDGGQHLLWETKDMDTWSE